jgi:hypothetical protein
MIMSVTDLKGRINCGTATDDLIAAQLEAVEAVIRAYTNNNFQARGVRLCGPSQGTWVYGAPLFFSMGDTVQISSDMGVNNGLYEVVAVEANGLQLSRDLLPVAHNLVTQVRYPADVVQCAVDLYRWKQDRGDKVGVKSETISRHSVTYEDSATLYMGYPVGILNGLKLHKKARC